VVDVKLIARRYLRSAPFIFDILSMLPTDFLYFKTSIDEPLVRINRLLRFHRLAECINLIEITTTSPNLFRVSKMLGVMLIAFHWNACAYFLCSRGAGLGADNWVVGYRKLVNPLVLGRPGSNATQYQSITQQKAETIELREYYEYGTRWPNSNLTMFAFSNLSRQYLLSFYWSALTLMVRDSLGDYGMR